MKFHVLKISNNKKSITNRYKNFCTALGFTGANDRDTFLDNRQNALNLLTQIEPKQELLNQENVAFTIQYNDINDTIKQLHDELDSLKARRSNIPLTNLKLPEQLCAAIGVSVENLPFVGELLNVHFPLLITTLERT
jgi:uncharacterized protein YPO0396